MKIIGLILIAPFIWSLCSTFWIYIFKTYTEKDHDKDTKAAMFAGLLTTMFIYGIYFLLT